MAAQFLALPDFIDPEFLRSAGGATVVLLVGFILLAITNKIAIEFVGPRLTPQGVMVLRKLIRYLGVAGIAIGFAAQTSLFNIISGFFLIGERPFELGDVIEIDGISGTVDTLGLLSLTLRTFDNRSVRIPNETLVKSKVVNVTRHPIRRFNLDIGVGYHENIGHVLSVLKNVAEKNVQCLDEPGPLLIFTGFGDSSLYVLLGAWCLQEDYGTLRNTLPRELKERVEVEDIEIPFPPMTIASGKAFGPIPIKMVDN